MPTTATNAPTNRSPDRQPPTATGSRGAAVGDKPALFAPLRALFNRKLSVQRRGMQLRFRLEPGVAAVVEPPVAASPDSLLRRDHQLLVELLDRQTDLRHTLGHLACVEQTLARHGSRALKALPEQVLRKAINQLEGLCRDDPEFLLPELAKRLKQTLAAMSERATDFSATEAMHVSEASHSLFDEMERSWNGRMPDAK